MKRQAGESDPSRSDRLATIWAIVEARKSFPTTIVVAGATLADDTGVIARGLAEAAQDAGQRTGYLQLGQELRSAVGSDSYASLSIAPRGTEREALDYALTAWRKQFDVVIVDIADIRRGPLGAHVVSVADGVVLGVCAARRVVAADRELAALLTQLASTVIGVVLTAPMAKASPPRRSPDRSRLAPIAQP